MPKAMWTGVVQFSLVTIPVKMLSAFHEKKVTFNQLHKDDGERIAQKKVCTKCASELSADDIVSGYDVGDGNFVQIEAEELALLAPEATKRIEIERFVDSAILSPTLIGSPYYLQSEKVGGKAYELLRKALERSGKVAIGRMVMRNREHLVAIRAVGGILAMSTLHWPDEIEPTDVVAPPAAQDVSERELELAQNIIATMVADDLGDPTDHHRQRVLDLIEAKAAGKAFTPSEERPIPPVSDLLAALEQSVATIGQ